VHSTSGRNLDGLEGELVRIQGIVGVVDGQKAIIVAEEEDMLVCDAPLRRRKLLNRTLPAWLVLVVHENHHLP
jgi:adenosine/AMP kinase